MAFDSKKQRKIMGQFATGVTVVTTGGEAGMHGLTANAVASLSLDPPLVLVAVNKRAATLEFLKKNRCFAVNILRVDQEEISRRFATPGPKDFSDLNVATAVTSAPILSRLPRVRRLPRGRNPPGRRPRNLRGRDRSRRRSRGRAPLVPRRGLPAAWVSERRRDS